MARAHGCRAFVALAAVLVPFAWASPLEAAEGGVTAYAPGSFASFMDALPSTPGFALFNYFTF